MAARIPRCENFDSTASPADKNYWMDWMAEAGFVWRALNGVGRHYRRAPMGKCGLGREAAGEPGGNRDFSPGAAATKKPGEKNAPACGACSGGDGGSYSSTAKSLKRLAFSHRGVAVL